jgi:pyruvate ferredoxin oxidoreductase alpha subunit
LHEQGENIGLIRFRVFRPFPKEEIMQALEGIERIGVIDRNISFGHEGIFFSEIKAAIYSMDNPPRAYDFIAGLGGRDVTPEDIENMIHLTKSEDISEVTWYGLKKDETDEEGAVCSLDESTDS